MRNKKKDLKKKERKQELRQEIKAFLSEEGIERLTQDQIDEKMILMVGEENARYLQRARAAGSKIDEHPNFYDAYQSLHLFYDVRIGFLSKMVCLIDSLPNETPLTIADGGCATGIDICFLAKHYQTSQHRFIGYDIIQASIELAEKRRQKLCLDNVCFKTGDHAKPEDSELGAIDLLYGKMCNGTDSDYIPELSGSILNACKRLKPKGIYVVAANMKKDAAPLADAIKEQGIAYIRTDIICHLPEYKSDVHNHVFRKE